MLQTRTLSAHSIVVLLPVETWTAMDASEEDVQCGICHDVGVSEIGELDCCDHRYVQVNSQGICARLTHSYPGLIISVFSAAFVSTAYSDGPRQNPSALFARSDSKQSRRRIFRRRAARKAVGNLWRCTTYQKLTRQGACAIQRTVLQRLAAFSMW